MKTLQAERPVFIANGDPARPVAVRWLRFRWHPGRSLEQRRRCIASLHEQARAELAPVQGILEVSRSSPDRTGRALSAFNLALKIAGVGRVPVESVYQCAKVFDSGGPFPELLGRPPDTVRAVLAGHAASALRGFRLLGRDWPTEPDTLFYDWLYAGALLDNPALLQAASEFSAFTDIHFNPRRSRACQAQALSRAVSLVHLGRLRRPLGSPDAYRELAFSRAERVEQAELPL